LGVVTIYVTHDQVEAMTLASRIAILRDGLLQQFDTPSEVYRRPANLFVAGFIGSPSMNLLPGVVEANTFRRAGLSVDLPAGIGPRRELTLGIRPEDIDFSTTSQPGYALARVWVTEDLGNETLLRLALDDTHITVRAAAGIRANFDMPAWFRIRPEKVHWFDSHTTEAIW
jgi:ABC-type sugar transport system ATPase subunit